MTKVRFTETALRDAHQSLLATRMRTRDMIPFSLLKHGVELLLIHV